MAVPPLTAQITSLLFTIDIYTNATYLSSVITTKMQINVFAFQLFLAHETLGNESFDVFYFRFKFHIFLPTVIIIFFFSEQKTIDKITAIIAASGLTVLIFIAITQTKHGGGDKKKIDFQSPIIPFDANLTFPGHR